MSNRIEEAKLMLAVYGFHAGWSIREVSARLYMARETAHRIRKSLVAVLAELGDDPLPPARKNKHPCRQGVGG